MTALPVVMLFLDPGTACGFAVGSTVNGKPLLISGEWDLSRSKHDAWVMSAIWLKRHIRELHKETGFTHLGYEHVVRHLGAHAGHMYGALVAAIQEVCLELGVSYEAVGVGTLKKFATGKGNASKEDMKRAARERWQVYTDSDNEADALAGWHWMQAQASGEVITEAAE
jgi:crossover junction endodeoxyribonuclease RuvC